MESKRLPSIFAVWVIFLALFLFLLSACNDETAPAPAAPPVVTAPPVPPAGPEQPPPTTSPHAANFAAFDDGASGSSALISSPSFRISKSAVTDGDAGVHSSQSFVLKGGVLESL